MNASKPLVKIIATGGSIAGVGPNRLDYILYPELGEHITIDQSLGPDPGGVGHRQDRRGGPNQRG